MGDDVVTHLEEREPTDVERRRLGRHAERLTEPARHQRAEGRPRRPIDPDGRAVGVHEHRDGDVAAARVALGEGESDAGLGPVRRRQPVDERRGPVTGVAPQSGTVADQPRAGRHAGRTALRDVEEDGGPADPQGRQAAGDRADPGAVEGRAGRGREAADDDPVLAEQAVVAGPAGEVEAPREAQVGLPRGDDRVRRGLALLEEDDAVVGAECRTPPRVGASPAARGGVRHGRTRALMARRESIAA